jgi:His/Glu/Gln/Arg/opine family amino acid ABC transporter permease subunit
MGYLVDPENWKWISSGRNLKFILEGFLVNIEIALIAMVFALIFGLLLALARLSNSKVVSFIAGAWIDVWRNLPLLFILLGFALALPGALFQAWEELVGKSVPIAFQSGRIVAALLGLVIYNSAVMAEIMRAGIVSLERGQGEAAAALGLPYWKSMRLVVLPQGLRRMVPATVSQLITLNKDTTLISIVAIREVLKHTKTVVNANPFLGDFVKAPPLQAYLFVGLLFVLVNLALSRLSQRLEIKQRQATGTKVKGITGIEDQVAAPA